MANRTIKYTASATKNGKQVHVESQTTGDHWNDSDHDTAYVDMQRQGYKNIHINDTRRTNS